MMPNSEQIQTFFENLQSNICTEIAKADGLASFMADVWQRPEGGGGITRVLTNGAILEKAGVAFSAVSGLLHDKMQETLQIDSKVDFLATGVSIVMHPHSPMVPIIHMNVRYFELSNGTYWFGGGIDLTPHYVNVADAAWFHSTLKNACDQFDPSYYSKYKNWADEYFFISHRNETRGVGGIFFDHLNAQSTGKSKAELFEFVKKIAEQFAPIYSHLMIKNHKLPFEQKHKDWQYIRRGRYAEFNLVWDRGTKFGLESNGRTESILMSLPPQANWLYSHTPAPNSPEAETLTYLKKGIDWL